MNNWLVRSDRSHPNLLTKLARKWYFNIMNQELPSAPRKSLVAKRSVVIGKHKTSVSVEDGFWSALKEIALERGIGIRELIENIDQNRMHSNLSSAIRVFVLLHYQSKLEAYQSTPHTGAVSRSRG